MALDQFLGRGGDDKISGTVGGSKFHATAADDGTLVRTLKHTFTAKQMNTESDSEELYAVIRLRNTDVDILMPTKKTPTFDTRAG